MIELILVIAILGILAVAVAPSFTNLLSSAATTGGLGTAGKIQSGINLQYSERALNNNPPFWVAALDASANGACSITNPCFTNVVQAITAGGWSRASNTTYTYSQGGISQTFTYTPATGLFVCTAGSC